MRKSKENATILSKLGKLLSNAKAGTLTVARTMVVSGNESLIIEECKRIFLDEVDKEVTQNMNETVSMYVCGVVCNYC